MEQFRTPDVLALCRAMRQEQDYGHAPVLADALEDGGCADEALLARLRDPALPWAAAAKEVAMILLPEAAESVAYVERMAEQIGAPKRYREEGGVECGERMTFASLLEAARKAQSHGGDGYLDGWYEGGVHMGCNEDYKRCFWDHEREFWRHYAVVTGLAVNDETLDFFSCGC